MKRESPVRGGVGGCANVRPAPLKQEAVRLPLASSVRRRSASPRAMIREEQ